MCHHFPAAAFIIEHHFIAPHFLLLSSLELSLITVPSSSSLSLPKSSLDLHQLPQHPSIPLLLLSVGDHLHLHLRRRRCLSLSSGSDNRPAAAAALRFSHPSSSLLSHFLFLQSK